MVQWAENSVLTHLTSNWDHPGDSVGGSIVPIHQGGGLGPRSGHKHPMHAWMSRTPNWSLYPLSFSKIHQLKNTCHLIDIKIVFRRLTPWVRWQKRPVGGGGEEAYIVWADLATLPFSILPQSPQVTGVCRFEATRWVSSHFIHSFILQNKLKNFQ